MSRLFRRRVRELLSISKKLGLVKNATFILHHNFGQDLHVTAQILRDLQIDSNAEFYQGANKIKVVPFCLSYMDGTQPSP